MEGRACLRGCRMRRMRFKTWANKDPWDETPMHVVYKVGDGRTLFFESGEKISRGLLEELRDAWVENVELRKDGWHIALCGEVQE